MSDQLARKYDYYTVAPEVSKPKKQRRRKQITKAEFMERRNAQLKRKNQMEIRKKLTLTGSILIVTASVLFLAIYIFFINGVL